MVTIILSIALLMSHPNQEVNPVRQIKQETNLTASWCSQPAAERDSLIREAAENQYEVRRVEFVGNDHIRDYVLRRRILLAEGDIFTLENLVKSLERMSRLNKIIHPVKLDDVIIRLDKTEKIIDMTICFQEIGAKCVSFRSYGAHVHCKFV